ncbi:hypothetical protein CTAYLR_001008 [Chrysophaeum taylorii]|uniref:Phosphoglycerate mutase-like protein n=1 Tax=Chrysophaeum taylorii TaxID=2483200 RepID=A0AAD7UFJ5_9STRA|nr:hypothetical protein CTAYLR_001008 [Chrysophaeum taylorii]
MFALLPLAMTQLYTESAKATAKIESAQHLEELRRQGVLGLDRSVKIRATPWRAGTEVPAGAKVVHLIRHGQGFHNLLGDLYRDFGVKVDSTGKESASPYTRPEIEDPPLTAIGREQAKALRSTTAELEVELVVTSPLARAAQTAHLAFPHLKGKVKWIGHEDVVETSGKNRCDKRRDLDEISDDFPYVDWSLVPEKDRWTADARETARSVSDRAHNFLLWLRTRAETRVAVATHSAWLFTLLNTAVTCDPPDLASWFMTGELRSLILEYEEN